MLRSDEVQIGTRLGAGTFGAGTYVSREHIILARVHMRTCFESNTAYFASLRIHALCLACHSCPCAHAHGTTVQYTCLCAHAHLCMRVLSVYAGTLGATTPVALKEAYGGTGGGQFEGCRGLHC